jgi:hypothetical protein
VGTNQIEAKAILNESRHHFEGIRGESHSANCSYVFENIIISWIRVSQTAKVAGFWGPGEDSGPICCHASAWVVQRLQMFCWRRLSIRRTRDFGI